jgi:hypothetical protein
MKKIKIASILFVLLFLTFLSIQPVFATFNTTTYQRQLAVTYANDYVYNNNSYFYNANVAGGDCTNFVSQAIRAGFYGTNSGISSRKIMDHHPSYDYSTGWYAGSGGGSSAWENNGAFFSYITNHSRNIGPIGEVISKSQMQNGDVMQMGYGTSYVHTVILVDRVNWKFAQHTTNRYRWIEDYEKIYDNFRFIRIISFRQPINVCIILNGLELCPMSVYEVE